MKEYMGRFDDQLWQRMVNCVAWHARPENSGVKGPKTMREFVAAAAAGYYDFRCKKDLDGDQFPQGKLPRGRRKKSI